MSTRKRVGGLIDDLRDAIERYPTSRPLNIYGCVMVVAAEWAKRIGLSREDWLRACGEAWDRLHSKGAG